MVKIKVICTNGEEKGRVKSTQLKMVKIKGICTNEEEKGRVKGTAAQEQEDLRLFVQIGKKRAGLRVQ